MNSPNSDVYTTTDIVMSFFLGVVAVMIFYKMFERQCVIVKGPKPNTSKKSILKNKSGNVCHSINLEQTSCNL